VHIPLASKSELVGKYRKRARERKCSLPHPVYAGLVEEVDHQVGQIVKEVEAQGLSDNTMIVFTSDNGGLNKRYDYNEQADDIVSDLAPLKGEKGSLHEGGIRVPLIVKYPKMIKRGTTCSEPTISYDFYPTFVAAARGSLPKNQTIDGLNILPLLQNPKAKLNRKALHWHYPHYHHDRPSGAIRERDWKLIEYLDGTGDIELYHISKDLSESNNLADERKGKVADLRKKLSAWRNEVLARIPVPNPSYDPDRAPEWWSRRSAKPIDSSIRKRFPATEKDL
ncbi:MAG: sulfatase/phosphatase domain-containing protein, partial [Verrucomicrobiota bacterium]|nr:sulfatase/phosphatase domain-containing protein [Verrucomicrobiota bacterium]